MFDVVLVPTDGSEPAETAAETGFDLARHHDADVHVLCVADIGPLSDLRLPGDAASAEEAIRGRADEFVERLTTRAAEYDLEATGVVRTGSAKTAIVTYANEIEADVVVMGPHGSGAVERLTLGSVTDHVIRASDADVLVAR